MVKTFVILNLCNLFLSICINEIPDEHKFHELPIWIIYMFAYRRLSYLVAERKIYSISDYPYTSHSRGITVKGTPERDSLIPRPLPVVSACNIDKLGVARIKLGPALAQRAIKQQNNH